MKPDDFFTERFAADDPTAINADPWSTTTEFNLEFAEKLRRSSLSNVEDLDAAIALTQLLHDDLERYGTGGGQRLLDDDLGNALRTLKAVLKRLGISFEVPFRSFATFRSHWIRNNMSGSWQARRDYLDGVFDPIHQRLTRLEEDRLESELVSAVSPRTHTGWPAVDAEVSELRRRFRSSSTPQDYRAVGTHCVGVIEALSRTVYDPVKHLREGETAPPPDKTKQRLGRYVEDALPGAENQGLRGLLNKAIEFAHHVKHSTTPTRREAGIAADATILLTNMLRRLSEPQ